MKRTFLIIAIFFTLIIAGCTKEYTCTCYYSVEDQLLETSISEIEGKKSEAEDACKEAEYEITSMGVTRKIECVLE